MTLALMLLMHGGGCAKAGPGGAAASGGTNEQGAGKLDDSACQPDKLGLGAARVVPLWKVPSYCTATPPAGAPAFAHNADELASLLKCSSAPPDLDLTQHTLVMSQQTLSPAGLGTTIYDDGKTLTFVSRSRTNCPSDPLPMPMNVTLSVLLPAGAERAVAEKSCTVRSECP